MSAPGVTANSSCGKRQKAFSYLCFLWYSPPSKTVSSSKQMLAMHHGKMACSITLKNISLVCIFFFFCSDFVKRLICMLAYPCRTMLLNVPHTNCKKRKRKSYAPKMWNKLPLHIREATCVQHLRNYPTLFNMISLLINQRCLFFFILHIAFTSLFPKALLF